jgi:hypothetical protein
MRSEHRSRQPPPMVHFDRHFRSISILPIMYCGSQKRCRSEYCNSVPTRPQQLKHRLWLSRSHYKSRYGPDAPFRLAFRSLTSYAALPSRLPVMMWLPIGIVYSRCLVTRRMPRRARTSRKIPNCQYVVLGNAIFRRMWYRVAEMAGGSHGCCSTDHCHVDQRGPAPGAGGDFSVAQRTEWSEPALFSPISTIRPPTPCRVGSG